MKLFFFYDFRVAVWAARRLFGRTPGRDDPAGRRIEIWTGPYPSSAGGTVTHTKENIYKMDELLPAEGKPLF